MSSHSVQSENESTYSSTQRCTTECTSATLPEVSSCSACVSSRITTPSMTHSVAPTSAAMARTT
jgi:hypothetical protein